jgi:beta-mannosidase
LAVIAVNDAAQAWDVTLEVTRRHFDGGILARATVPVSARPGHNHVVGLTPELWRPGDPAREVLVVSAPGYRAFWYFAEDKDLELPPPGLSAHVEEAEDGFAVVVQASSLQRDVALLADRLGPEAECDDMLFTLLPGESRRVQVRSRARPSTEELLAAGALRSANQLAREALGPGPGAAAGSGAVPAWPNIV